MAAIRIHLGMECRLCPQVMRWASKACTPLLIFALCGVAHADNAQEQWRSKAGEIRPPAENDTAAARLLQLTRRFQTESKQREIDKLNGRNQQQAAELKHLALEQRWLWTVLGGSVGVLVGTAFFLFRLRRSHYRLAALNTQMLQAKNKLQATLDMIPDLMFELGLDGRYYDYHSPRTDLLAAPAENLFGKTVPEILPANAAKICMSALHEAHENGVSTGKQFELSLPNGNFWFELSVAGKPVEAGEEPRFIVLSRDITERKRAEHEIRTLNADLERRVLERTEALRLQTRYLRALIDTLPMMAWLKDKDSRFLVVNQATALACADSVDGMVGKTDLDFWPREHAEAYRLDDAEVMATRQRKTAEASFADADGGIWIETFKAPVLDEDGSVLGTVGIARDISERKAMESAREAALVEAERLARLRSEFMARMSHELRTPLNGILGYAQMLLGENRLTERQDMMLNVIQQSGEYLLNLINEILDFAKIEAGKQELSLSDVPLPGFLRNLAGIISVRAEQKQLAFVCDIATNVPEGIRVDETRLRQVLLNLLSNAVKYSEQGQVSLRVTVLEPGRLRFEIQDSGIGIESGHLKTIFQPFEQAGNSQHRDGGAGLGLAISCELLRLMGSAIDVTSRVGQGSTFGFDLDVPFVGVCAGVIPAEQLITGYRGPRRRVMVVDDVDENRTLLVDILSHLGFETVEAANGRECLDSVEIQAPDLILLDMVMPEMDGLEAAHRLRCLPGFGQTPIIAVSASASSNDIALAMKAGVSFFLSKPIDIRKLMVQIAGFLKLDLVYALPDAGLPSQYGPNEWLDAPSQEEMEILYRLAQEGSMRDIIRQAAYMEGLDQRYRPFARQLRTMAQCYQSKAILELVERYINRNPTTMTHAIFAATAAPTVLIVDDIPVNLGVAVEHLEARGYRVVIAQEGEEGLQRAVLVQPDIILLDVMLPGQDGFEICRRLKADAKTRNIPVIFMTALSEEGDKLAGFKAGGVDYITKPLRIGEVIARVDTHLNLSLMQKQLLAQNQQLQQHRQELKQQVAERTAELSSSNHSLEAEIGERQRAEAALRDSERQYRSLVENTPDTIVRYDRNCRCLYANPNMIKELGGEAERILNRTLAEFPGGNPAIEYQARIGQVFADGRPTDFEWSWQSAEDRQLVSYIRLTPEFDADDGVASVLAVGRDITEIDEYRRNIHRLAFYDVLTNLPNRALLAERMRQTIADAALQGYRFALLLLDLDRFKDVNDTLGHGVGDLLLCDVAERLQHCVRACDMVARLGGDEFAMLLPQVAQGEDMAALADKIVNVFELPFQVSGTELFISASIGIALYPDDSTDIDALFRYADSAMYHAKKQGRNNFQLYARELTTRSSERITLEAALRYARNNDELELYYQPQVDLTSGHITGAEALLRWNRQEGAVTPDKFIPVAEDSGLIVSIGEWVLLTACKAAVQWNIGRAIPFKIAVNLSTRQFLQNDLLASVRDILQKTQCQPQWLKLEITESLLLDDSSEILEVLNAFDVMELALSIDDFGTGYSALSYLNRFPVSQIKIDQSFVSDIPADQDKSELVKAMIFIAQALHLELIAEGVETREQADYLNTHGCLAAQGYLFGKPMPHAEFETWLARSRQ